MVQRYAPTILSSRTISGIIPSSSPQNVAWNSDGQCLVVHRRGIVILTPYITSTLTPPATLVDPHLNLEYATATVNRAKRKALAVEDGDVEMEEDEAVSGPSKRCRRPVGGEVMFWQTEIGIENEANRERSEHYGWAEVGDEFNGTISDRDTYVKKAVWSPSGLGELGGCYLAVLTTMGQVSIYGPRSDPASQKWDEITDITLMTKQLLYRKHTSGLLSVRGMLEMRTIGMEWSKSVSCGSETGESGGLLAIANRAGMVALWACRDSRQFERVAYVQATEGFVIHMSFTSWTTAYEGVYDGQLAMANSDGSISVMAIRQQESLGESEPWKYLMGDVKLVDGGDGRVVTSLRWVGEVLVWSKAGTVQFWNDGAQATCSWSGLRSVRLEKVGSWASANAMGSPVAIEPYGQDGIAVTLSSMTRHLIGTIHTSPALLPLAESLRLSVASRDCFYDYLHTDVYLRDRLRDEELDDRDVTARMNGLEAVGSDWSVDSWAVEGMHYHNLNSSTEGIRMMNFMIADLSGVLGDPHTLPERLEALLANPPKAAWQSPIKTIMPYVMRVWASPDPQSYAEDLLELCVHEATEAITVESPSATRALMRSLWENKVLDGLRLRYVLTLWATKYFSSHKSQFVNASQKLLDTTSAKIQAIVLRWTARMLGDIDTGALTPIDHEFIRSTIENESSGSADGDMVRTIIDEAGDVAGNIDPSLNEDKCPACHEAVVTVAPGTAKCSRGHEWARCSMTNLLITTSAYRVCNTCPAISLFPSKFATQVSPVAFIRETIGEQGSVTPPRGELVETLLEAATVCVLCGGRWVRSM